MFDLHGFILIKTIDLEATSIIISDHSRIFLIFLSLFFKLKALCSLYCREGKVGDKNELELKYFKDDSS